MDAPSAASSKTKVSAADKDVQDGEIMDDEIDPQTIRINKLAQAAAITLGQNDDSERNSVRQTPVKKDLENVPEDMLCLGCQDARRAVVIVACKHLVFCKKCNLDYALKNPNNTTCPICRKAYK